MELQGISAVTGERLTRADQANRETPVASERPIPQAALRYATEVEILRVWIAEKKHPCSLKVGMYRETTNVPEERAWGTILADAARHVANALESGYGANATESLRMIRDAFNKEIEAPSSIAEGDFSKRH